MLAAGDELAYLQSGDPHINLGLQDQVWSTDGTVSGTRHLLGPVAWKDYSTASYALWGRLGELVLFADQDRAVWRTDGTQNGTFKLWDVPPFDFSQYNPTPPATGVVGADHE
jgi:hypothetical protein